MASAARPTTGQANAAFVSWLVTGAVGPALVALPVNLVADKLAGAAVRWFKRLRQTDDLSRLVKAAAGVSVQLSRTEIRDLRRLLEEEQTWRLLAAGKLNDKLQELIGQIAACLSARDGRITEDAREAASAIARGLLEFAVFDLQPEVFQKVVLGRLQQMSDQATAMDEALFRLHMDLYAFAEGTKDLFRQVMDQLPPGSADLGEVRIYLTALIDWLNIDPWPQDPRLGGPRLTPAAIERELQLTVGGPSEQDTAADDLARQCSRLVILGDPGSGKTWLAMRTARLCAEKALAALDDVALEEVELPLYTSCSRLAIAPGDIREATVSSAIDWIGDLGGSRIVKALRLFFTERKAEPTLLVIDSLDEAGDSNAVRGRLRQVGSLQPPWRVVLTSRPSSWENQLNLDPRNQDQRVGILQPLRFPDDVESVIQRWFADRPEQGEALAAQIARRPSLQQAATVPLILAFYCILGGQQLPESRHELYSQVINRMLHAPWRSGGGHPPDLNKCRAVLRTWAWKGAQKNHPVSGVGLWEDDISTRQAKLSAAGQIAVDHIAAPRGGPDFDTDETWRCFVHRSIREHLVADHIATNRSLDQAAEDLLPHLWFDQDWEYVVPAAIAMHPERNELLRKLLCRAACADQIPADISVIDGVGELRVLLARIATESSQADWSPELANIIGQAKAELALTGRTDELGWAPSWTASNRQIRETLLRLLNGPVNGEIDGNPRGAIIDILGEAVRLVSSSEEQRAAREALLRLLVSQADAGTADLLADGLAVLAPTAEEQRQACEALLRILSGPISWMQAVRLVKSLLGLTTTAQERHVREALLSLLPSHTDAQVATQLARAVADLSPTEEDQHKVHEVLLRLQPSRADPAAGSLPIRGMVQLAWTAEERREARQALLDQLSHLSPRSRDGQHTATQLALEMLDLDPEAEDRRRASQLLLNFMDYGSWDNNGKQEGLPDFRQVGLIVRFARTAEEKRRARQGLLRVLARQGYVPVVKLLVDAIAELATTPSARRETRKGLLKLISSEASLEITPEITKGIVQLDPTPDDRQRTSRILLDLLINGPIYNLDVAENLISQAIQLEPTRNDPHQIRAAVIESLANAVPDEVIPLTESLNRLAPTAEDQRQARQVLLGKLSSQPSASDAATLVRGLTEFAPQEEDQRQARQALLSLLSRQTSASDAATLAQALADLAPQEEDRRQARQTLLRLLSHDAVSRANTGISVHTMDTLVQLTPAVDDQRRLRDALLCLLTDAADASTATMVIRGLNGLWPTTEDQRQACQALLSLLSRQTSASDAATLAHALADLAPQEDEQRQARQALLSLLSRQTSASDAATLADALADLAPQEDEQRQARQALLELLPRQTSAWQAQQLKDALLLLKPTVHDLSKWRPWTVPPTVVMLAEARRNSPLPDWLSALNWLPQPSDLIA
jgi:hypothetical protein